MRFCCSTGAVGIGIVPGLKQSSPYSSENAADCVVPAASHRPTAPSPRNEGLGQSSGTPHFRLSSLAGRVCRGW